jgi:fructoselysine-6-P-deglycase FrlB-like protein
MQRPSDAQPAAAQASLAGYIEEQPWATDMAFTAAAELRTSGWLSRTEAGLALVGSGSSYNALLASRPGLSRASAGPVSVHGAEDFLREFAGTPREQKLIVLSQSGNSRTSVAAARAVVAAGGECLAITMNPAAEIGTTGAHLLVLPIGPESIGPKTKGFTASLAALAGLSGARPAPAGWLAPLIASSRLAAEALVPALDDVDWIMVCGRGAQYGIALEASLKIAEIAGIPSAAFPWEEALHGRLHGLTGRSLALFIATTAEDVEDAEIVAAAMHRRGVAVRVINLTGRAGSVDAWLAPAPPTDWATVAAILPFQWLATGLAEARGLVPEEMRYPGLSADLNIKFGPATAGNQ